MGLFRKKKIPRLQREDALGCIPLKNKDIEESVMDSGEVQISYPVQIKPWIANMMKKFGGPEKQMGHRKLQLDLMGSTVWRLIDGRRTVRLIINKFADDNKLHPREAEVSVTQFFRELGRRGIIGVKAWDEPSGR